jgi:hypothetical protein
MLDIVILAAAAKPPTVTLRASTDALTEEAVVPVSAGTADQFAWALAERPFSTTKPGTYSVHVTGVSESKDSLEKTVEFEIRKGKAKAARSFAIEKSLFLLLWNVFHHGTVPSRMGGDQRTT